MGIDPELLRILACPACRAAVVESDDQILCTSKDCRRQYAVSEGIPVMLIDESIQLDTQAWQQAFQKASATPKAP